VCAWQEGSCSWTFQWSTSAGWHTPVILAAFSRVVQSSPSDSSCGTPSPSHMVHSHGLAGRSPVTFSASSSSCCCQACCKTCQVNRGPTYSSSSSVLQLCCFFQALGASHPQPGSAKPGAHVSPDSQPHSSLEFGHCLVKVAEKVSREDSKKLKSVFLCIFSYDLEFLSSALSFYLERLPSAFLVGWIYL
jgi:hypothetical protein